MIWEIRYELIGYLDLATRRSLTVANAKKVSVGKDGGCGGFRQLEGSRLCPAHKLGCLLFVFNGKVS